MRALSSSHGSDRFLRILVFFLSAAMAVPLAAADGDPLGTGLAAFDLGGNNADSAAAVLVQPDGKVIVVGTVTTGAGTWSPALARFLPGGTLGSSIPWASATRPLPPRTCCRMAGFSSPARSRAAPRAIRTSTSSACWRTVRWTLLSGSSALR